MRILQRRIACVTAATLAVIGWGIGEASANIINPSFESPTNLFGDVR